ncbi:MAG TPA: hypothetical protein VFG42_02415 [Baekduia sp.]|uniref:hypothetical protein n=1 Tax=Baekduia sp. TaxID=2600305 RepID=UPI002D766124|nr:hypothetical protein [Baekduia sp.]HET6505620.1 hypothetical protein [Baekduia sp.]
MTLTHADKAIDLPPDNASRLAIFDAFYDVGSSSTPQSLTENELFERVIGRLRVLVPRELHLAGEATYVHNKLEACAEAGLISMGSLDGDAILALTGQAPLIRYPDGELRDYTPGLELARERLDGDNARLRAAEFDVRALIPSSADEPNGPEFQALLASMREHGFLRQFWIAALADDVVIDGRARKRAAEMLGLEVEYVQYRSDRDRNAARRRDTPLNRVMLAIQSNLHRLDPETVQAVHEAVAKVTKRVWADTAADLELTAEWRLAVPAEYVPHFEARKVAFRPGAEPKIQVTPDDKVMVRSLLEVAGILRSDRIKTLNEFVAFEKARSPYTGGKKADFARADDLIAGIAAMQEARRAAKRKIDPEWDDIREWLVASFDSRST